MTAITAPLADGRDPAAPHRDAPAPDRDRSAPDREPPAPTTAPPARPSDIMTDDLTAISDHAARFAAVAKRKQEVDELYAQWLAAIVALMRAPGPGGVRMKQSEVARRITAAGVRMSESSVRDFETRYRAAVKARRAARAVDRTPGAVDRAGLAVDREPAAPTSTP